MATNAAHIADRFEFVHLLKSMLAIEQGKRVTPAEALGFAFISMVHLLDLAVFPRFVRLPLLECP